MHTLFHSFRGKHKIKMRKYKLLALGLWNIPLTLYRKYEVANAYGNQENWIFLTDFKMFFATQPNSLAT